jgi:hypothetical protein
LNGFANPYPAIAGRHPPGITQNEEFVSKKKGKTSSMNGQDYGVVLVAWGQFLVSSLVVAPICAYRIVKSMSAS